MFIVVSYHINIESFSFITCPISKLCALICPISLSVWYKLIITGASQKEWRAWCKTRMHRTKCTRGVRFSSACAHRQLNAKTDKTARGIDSYLPSLGPKRSIWMNQRRNASIHSTMCARTSEQNPSSAHYSAHAVAHC